MQSINSVFLEEALLEPSRLLISRLTPSTLATSLWDVYLKDVSSSRKISKEQLNNSADSLLCSSPKAALALKLVDHIDSVIGPEEGKLHAYPGHPVIEMALMRLYDVTNDPNTLCYRGDFVLEDGENIIQFIGVVAMNGGEEIEFDQGKFILDFGGCPAGFEAKVSNIIIQKHKAE